MGIIKSFALATLIGVAIIGLTISSSRAATVQTANFGTGIDYATGIDGLVVGAVRLDVVFVLDSYENIFPEGIFFSDATGLNNSIIAALNALDLTGVVQPSTLAATYLVPMFDPGGGANVTALMGICGGSSFLEAVCAKDWRDPGSTLESSPSLAGIAWATTSNITVIPLPAALPLFLTGLAGLGLMRRRRRQQQV